MDFRPLLSQGTRGMEKAVILCDGYFGQSTGKTANGLVRYSKRYEIAGVIDHAKAGRDAREGLDGKPNGIPVLGTDGAIGKRTTALLLTDALNAAGVPAAFVATGQTGLLQGSAYGVPLDSIKADFMVGELESEVVRAYDETQARVIVVEGQGSISHPAYVCGTRAIIMASMPSAILMMHAPARKTRSFRRDVVAWPMPSVDEEIEWLQFYTRRIGGGEGGGVGSHPPKTERRGGGGRGGAHWQEKRKPPSRRKKSSSSHAQSPPGSR